MNELFDRRAIVTLGTSPTSRAVLEGLRTQFKIEKNDDEAPNAAEISVWNLSKTTRGKILALGTVPVVLEAGYGNSLALLFKGDILPYGVGVVRNGADWLTTFKVGDGLESYRSDRVQLPVGKGEQLKQVALKLLGQFKGVDTKDAVSKINSGATNLTGTFAKFFGATVLSGGAIQELNRILKGVGMRASSQDGTIKLHPVGGFVDDLIPSLSPTSGLIGSPEPAKDGFTKFKCFLRPEISPFYKVKVTCASHPQGIFLIAQKVTHSGDTRGQEWYTDVEGKAA